MVAFLAGATGPGDGAFRQRRIFIAKRDFTLAPAMAGGRRGKRFARVLRAAPT
jgi:hypothetical protein